MAAKRGNCTLRSTGRKILGQRYIRLVLSEIGFDETVQVKAPVKRDPTTGQVSFTWILADPNIDAWNPATEEGNATPTPDPIAVEPLDVPLITSATVNFSADSGAGAPGAFMRLAVVGPDREDLTWYARTRIVGAAVWGEREYSDLDPGASVTIDTEFVPTDAMVEAEVQYKVGDGRLSGWSGPVQRDTSTEDVVIDYDGGDATGTGA
jgi:hypothetical protein